MDIQQTDDGKDGMFYIQTDGVIQAEMTYVWSGDKRIIIDHTSVSEILKGKNIGKQLVQKAVDFAREKQIKILPLCPFAKAVFEKIPAYSDVLF